MGKERIMSEEHSEKHHAPTRDYVIWKDSTFMHDVALAYAIRVMTAVSGWTYATALISWLGTRRKYYHPERREIVYDLKVVFAYSEHLNYVVEICLERILNDPRSRYLYKLRKCAVRSSGGCLTGMLFLPDGENNEVIDSVEDPLRYRVIGGGMLEIPALH